MKTIIFLSLIAFLTSCNKASVEGDVEEGKHANVHVNGEYVWYSSGFPKTLRISSAFTTDEITRIKEMGAAWSTAVENKKTFFNYGSNVTEKSNTITSMDNFLDSVFGVYKTSDWSKTGVTSMALAITQIYGLRYNEGEYNEFVDIRHADILVNYDDYDFYTGDNKTIGEASFFDLRTVVLHELGHFLGLQHRTGDSVMVASVDESDTNRAPTEIDQEDIAGLYNVTLSTLLAGKTTAMMVAPSRTFKPSGTGKEVRILIELHANGECIHKENGAVVKRHSAKIH